MGHIFSIEKPSFVYGSFQGDAPGPSCNQIPHVDIEPVFIGDVEHTVTSNPRLKKHGKPSSVITPLHDWRDVYIYNGNF